MGQGASAALGTSVTPGAEALYLLDTAHRTNSAVGTQITAESSPGTEGTGGFSQETLEDAVLSA